MKPVAPVTTTSCLHSDLRIGASILLDASEGGAVDMQYVLCTTGGLHGNRCAWLCCIRGRLFTVQVDGGSAKAALSDVMSVIETKLVVGIDLIEWRARRDAEWCVCDWTQCLRVIVGLRGHAWDAGLCQVAPIGIKEKAVGKLEIFWKWK